MYQSNTFTFARCSCFCLIKKILKKGRLTIIYKNLSNLSYIIFTT